MFVRRFAALTAALVTACGVGATEEQDPAVEAGAAQVIALGQALVGTYTSVADTTARFELQADLTYSVKGGESGSWNLYHSPVTGNAFVGIYVSGSSRWLRILQGTPLELVGVFGTDGDFVQTEAPLAPR